MPRFSRDRFPPGFFDLPPDAGAALPLDVIEAWTRSDQSRESARRILGPHAHRGFAVASDAAGLTRLSQELPLALLLALINRPKEVIHACGRAVGGRPVGVWVADNTLMLYPRDLPAASLVAMLRAVLERLAAEATVGVGLCAHAGTFFELGGALYGPDADRVETLAEEHTEAGELLVTDQVARALPDGHGFALAARDDLAAAFGGVLRVEGGPAADLDARDERYPAPFDDALHDELHRYATAERRSQVSLPQLAYAERAVVLVEREPDDPDLPEVAVLNDLALAAAATRIAGQLLARHGGEAIKTSGRLGLYTFEEPAAAAAFAQEFRRAFAEQGVATRSGIDVGEVLIFDLGAGQREIAGAPVNVASKLAQDCGEFGRIYLSAEATQRARLERRSETVTFAVSGISLTARML